MIPLVKKLVRMVKMVMPLVPMVQMLPSNATANEFIIIAFCYERAGLVAVRDRTCPATPSLQE